MFKRTITPTRTPDRLSYLWLALGAALLLFVGGQWIIPLAAWLAPLFLLRFVRTKPLLPGLLLVWLVKSAVAAVAQQGIIMVSGVGYYALVVLVSLVTLLPYLADRLLTPRLRGFVATLVFPVTFTMFEYLSSFSSFGTINSIANTQYGDLPLMQVVSVTGIWGITFLITWFAAVVNWAWERGFAWPQVRGGGLLYAGILAVVLLGGGARLALFPPQATLVRVAGLSASQAAVAAFNQQLPQATLSLLLSGKATPADRAIARSAFTTLDDDLLARSQQEARAGAKIVVWPETSPTGASILQEDEPALIQRAGTLAREAGIYLDMGLAVFLPDAGNGPFLKDEAVLLDPTGNVVWTYEKTHLVPFGEQGLIVPGDGKVPTVESPYGRLAGVICFDADFPSTMRQAGQARADLMLVPGDDWQAIDPYHTYDATFRAIENGFSEVREASKGLSMTVDYEGRVLAASDYYTTDQQIMVAYVPVHGVRTIYATIGDLFAWLCIIGLVALTGLAIMQSRKRPSAAAAAPLPEPQPIR
ncbi:MAG: apolipoprotein N-acyltransferase [Ktedonobacteraceae bacterium]